MMFSGELISCFDLKSSCFCSLDEFPIINNSLFLFKEKLRNYIQQLFLFIEGIRGAVAFALAIQYTHNQIQQTMFSTTLIIVIVTVIFCGALTTHMLVFLKIRWFNVVVFNLILL